MGIINLQGVTKIYQTKEVETVALENVNLEVKAGEFLSVMGPSGCGKSTMLNLIGLLDVPTEGAVTVDGAATGRMKDAEMAEFRNKTLGFVFQSFHLINSLNVLDNVELPLLYRKSPESCEGKCFVRCESPTFSSTALAVSRRDFSVDLR